MGLQICVRQTVRLTTEFLSRLMQERVYMVQTAVRDTSRCDQRLEAQRLIDAWASILQNVIDEAVGQWRKRLRASMKANDITLNIC